MHEVKVILFERVSADVLTSCGRIGDCLQIVAFHGFELLTKYMVQELAIVIQCCLLLLLTCDCVATSLQHSSKLNLLNALVLLESSPFAEVSFDDRP